MKKVIFALILSLALTACTSKPTYTYLGDLGTPVYYKSKQATGLLVYGYPLRLDLEEQIEVGNEELELLRNEANSSRPRPGANLTYAYFRLKLNDRDQAIHYLKREAYFYPESKKFVDLLLTKIRSPKR
ncbi:hypothetical protein CKF54_07815 [Psittacicella hinzii]|uniref:DUF4810 domain-containing protein n=1 Tax=Psittacicella hinzii TaxID=2028575 RepID=A0A3A1Y0F0_9GAMM|nr:DUF4810 domain-containing protein [Psittacicella hinzii]RIY31065.1 hypothetical protein CKF54_07815 [Psittacicella hinzii]